MKENVYWLILTNTFRVYRNRIIEQTERIVPELRNFASSLVYFYILTQILFIVIIVAVNFQENQFVRNTADNYGKEIIVLKFILEILLFNNISKFSFPKKLQMIYGFFPSMFYILCSNFKHFYTFILIQLVYMKLFPSVLAFILFVVSCSITFAFLYAKLVLFTYTEIVMKAVFFFASILFLFMVAKELLETFDVYLHISVNQLISLTTLLIITVIILIFTIFLFKKVNTTNYILKDSHRRTYTKSILLSIIILAAIMILSQTFMVINQVEYPLVLMSFLLITLLVKIRFVHFLTIETYGYFLFYIKATDHHLQRSMIKKIQMNNVLLLLPILLIHSSYFLIQKDFIFLGILVALYVLDIKIDELVIYMTRKIVKKNELPNLFLHSKKGLSSVLLIAFIPIALISYIVKSNQSILGLMGINILVILLSFIACVSLVTYIWKRSFFEDLFK